jgi:hypothetical protein
MRKEVAMKHTTKIHLASNTRNYIISTDSLTRNGHIMYQMVCPTGIMVSSCICKEENITNQNFKR